MSFRSKQFRRVALIACLLIAAGVWSRFLDRRKSIFLSVGYASRSVQTPRHEVRATRRFESLLGEIGEITYDELQLRMGPDNYLKELPFDPRDAKHFSAIEKQLSLTPEQVELYQRNGFVASDSNRQYSFPAAYYEVYHSDLPV